MCCFSGLPHKIYKILLLQKLSTVTLFKRVWGSRREEFYLVRWLLLLLPKLLGRQINSPKTVIWFRSWVMTMKNLRNSYLYSPSSSWLFVFESFQMGRIKDDVLFMFQFSNPCNVKRGRISAQLSSCLGLIWVCIPS